MSERRIIARMREKKFSQAEVARALLVYIDDATGKLLHLRFAGSENTFDYLLATKADRQSLARLNHSRPAAHVLAEAVRRRGKVRFASVPEPVARSHRRESLPFPA